MGDADAIRLAHLDGHAERRFAPLLGPEAEAAANRCRELFDAKEVLQAFVAEVNSFNEASPPESLACLFLSWADEHLEDKHMVLDQETCSRTDVNLHMALRIFEALFPCASVLGARGESVDEVEESEDSHIDFQSPHSEASAFSQAGGFDDIVAAASPLGKSAPLAACPWDLHAASISPTALHLPDVPLMTHGFYVGAATFPQFAAFPPHRQYGVLGPDMTLAQTCGLHAPFIADRCYAASLPLPMACWTWSPQSLPHDWSLAKAIQPHS